MKKTSAKSGNRAIRRLASSNNRKNRSRSMLIMLAITLSTVLLTMITSYGIGLVRYEKASAAGQYGSFYGMFAGISDEQLDALKSDENFTDLGIMENCGYVDSESDINLITMDDKAAALSSFDEKIAKGKMPVKEDEIMASEAMFRSLGYEKVNVGDRISLSFRPDLKSEYGEKEFTVCGIFAETEAEEAGIDSGSYSGVVSEKFFAKNCQGDRLCTVLFRMADDIKINSENAEELIGSYAEKCGISGSQIRVNTMYILFAMSPGSEILFTCIFLIACVILFSMIVIYNIFQISLVQRMQEYGRIKAVGATSRQMKRLINREGMLLALPSVPSGAAAGYAAAYVSFGWVTKTAVAVQNVSVSDFTFFSPAAVFGSMLLAFITVWLALVKPKRTISRISVVDAIDYREGMQMRGSGRRRGYSNINEHRLALANIGSDKKHAAMTMATMGLTCVLFVVMANCIGNIDSEYEARKSVSHGQFAIDLDYTFYDKAYPDNNLDVMLQDNPLNEDLIKKLESIPAVTDVMYQDVLVSDIGGQLDSVLVLSREDFRKKYDSGKAVGSFDYDSATEKNQIIYGWSAFLEDTGMKIGDRIEGSLYDGSEKKDFALTLGGSFGNCRGGWAITEDTARKMGFEAGKSIETIWVDCSEKDAEAVESRIRSILGDEKHLEFETLANSRAEQEFGSRMIKSAVYALLIVIGIIGFANLANMMIINITTKRREYGIMQAVGMTDRQLRKSLSFQGLIYTGGTLAVSMAVGIPIGYMAFRWCRKAAYFGMNVYHFPGVELVIMTVVLVAMQLVLSYLLGSNLKRESLVDRIRY